MRKILCWLLWYPVPVFHQTSGIDWVHPSIFKYFTGANHVYTSNAIYYYFDDIKNKQNMLKKDEKNYVDNAPRYIRWILILIDGKIHTYLSIQNSNWQYWNFRSNNWKRFSIYFRTFFTKKYVIHKYSYYP